MPGLAEPAIVIGLLLLGLGIGLGLVIGRRYVLGRASVSFDCALRRSTTPGPGGWMLGVARLGAGDLEWFRVFAFTTRPNRVFARTRLEVQERRSPPDLDLDSVLPGSWLVRCRYGDEVAEFAMSEAAYVGFATWLEAGPPSGQQ